MNTATNKTIKVLFYNNLYKYNVKTEPCDIMMDREVESYSSHDMEDYNLIPTLHRRFLENHFDGNKFGVFCANILIKSFVEKYNELTGSNLKLDFTVADPDVDTVTGKAFEIEMPEEQYFAWCAIAKKLNPDCPDNPFDIIYYAVEGLADYAEDNVWTHDKFCITNFLTCSHNAYEAVLICLYESTEPK